MLTTPARSENSPPSAARPIGTASSSAAAIVDDEVSASSPLIARTIESSDERAERQPERAPDRPPPVSRSVTGLRPGACGVVRAVLMPAPPGARRWIRRPAASRRARRSARPPWPRAVPRSAARRVTRRATSLAMTTASTMVPWKIVTTDGGKSAICSGTERRSRKANSSAASAMPTGLVAAEQRHRDARGTRGRR